MKIIFTILVFISSFSQAAVQDIGLGVILGDPTGLSMKVKLNNEQAVDAALAWSSLGVHLHGNFLWQNENYVNVRNQSFDLFYGVGARIISITSGSNKDKSSFGPRVPLGLNYTLKNTRLQFFAELALNLNLTPSSDADLDGGIGLRFHF